jgi:DNA-binding transcriptional regulator/RsmH inhibitor MraZ
VEILEKGKAARDHGAAFDRLEEGRLNFADLEKVTFDDGGRFALDDVVKDVMGITDCLFFVGNGWAFEVWAPEAFLASDIGSRMGKIRCKSLLDQYRANPKTPNRAGA